ncbi:hypothetical protein FIBSPDRAFT_872091 [Athelia psychrophila]|uniref:Uncharacterized protein n=1 Tax=Athelia psychrophila TaxID=1759441 RepID=A0A165ZUA6_9AGAM|nr:hypothetical protein FIBSPDRAFT_872091 [Fibularhizoctonia sp. CBS 109695]
MAAPQISHLNTIIYCFAYIRNSLKSKCADGVAWVSEAVKAGLLLAFVNASPH